MLGIKSKMETYIFVKKQEFLEWAIQFWLVQTIVSFIQDLLLNILKLGPMPTHLSFIMDGNRRYAKNLNIPVKKGHEAGAKTLIKLLHACKVLDIQMISTYAFSIENFNRSTDEVSTLTMLLGEKLDEFGRRAQDHEDKLFGIRIRVVGDRSYNSTELNKKIDNVEKLTRDGDKFFLYICFPYTSRNDIVHSIKSNIESHLNNGIEDKDIDINSLTNSMYFDKFSNKCDLLIRTSGHTRLSDYMLWQTHENGNIEFINCLWPDFNFFNFYFIMLKWSFSASFQNIKNMRQESMHNDILEFLKGYLIPNYHKPISIDNLPPPPRSISIIGT